MYEKIEQTCKTAVESKLNNEVKKTVDEKVMDFSEIMKQQVKEEVQVNLDETLKKEFMNEFSDVRAERAEQEDIETCINCSFYINFCCFSINDFVYLR